MANGIYTNTELIEAVLNDLNTYLKLLSSGQHAQACIIMAGAIQKLINLRDGVANDMKNRDKTIEHLKDELRSRGVEIVDVPPEVLTNEHAD